MYSIGATYGYLDQNDPPESWNANLLIDTPKQLLDWLKAGI
jgi:phosphoglycolate phosphatase-like HAD superfamily hydrolase